jgi:DNA invertase Pin-like site-specific DNA recombinase
MTSKEAIHRVAAVLRVSTAAQRKDDQEDSIDNQRQWAEEWAESVGWDLVKVYDETADQGFQSGRAPMNERPFIQEMLADAARGQFDAVLFRDSARLGRDDIEALILGRDLLGFGVLVGFSKERRIADIEDQNDRLLFYINQWQADTDFSNLTWNMRRGKFDAMAAGKWSGGSSPPKGYKIDKNDNTIILDPEAAPYVVRTFEVIAAGRSSYEASEILGPEFRQAGVAFGTSNRVMARTVRQTAYRGDGVVRWAAHPSTDRGHRCADYKKTTAGTTFCAACRACKHEDADENAQGRLACPYCGKERFVFPAPALVDSETWKKANAALDIAARKSRPFDPGRSRLTWHDYGFGGGRMVHVHDGYGDGTEVPVEFSMHGTGRTEGRVYHCRAAKKKAGLFGPDDPNRCRGFGVNAANGRRMTSLKAGRMEAEVLLLVLEKLKDADTYASWVKSEAKRLDFGTGIEDPAERLAHIEAVVADEKAKHERWIDQYGDGLISKDKRDEKLAATANMIATQEALRRSIEEKASFYRDALITYETLIRTPVGGPGLGDVDYGYEPFIDPKTGVAVHEDWSWTEAARWLAGEAEAVLGGSAKDLAPEVVAWVERMAEVFDLRVKVYEGDADGRPIWEVEGNIPLMGPETTSRYSVRPTSMAKSLPARSSLAVASSVK